MNQATILVTGGGGFIGSHLCETLLKNGHTVIAVDNFSSSSKNNIAHLQTQANFTCIEHDIEVVTEFLDANVNLDYIYNLACPASPIQYQKDPLKTIKTNVLGTLNMLELAAKHNAIFVQASTSEVYGDPEVHPQPEHYLGHVNTVGPRACYDEGKRCAETLCYEYAEQKGVPTKIGRIFNTYGPRMASDDGRVVSNFIVQALRNEPISIYGDGSQTRSFQYVDDLVTGLLALGNHPTFNGPVNLGSEFEMTVKDLAETIIALTKSSSQIIYEPMPVDDPKQRRPDTTLAKKELSIDSQTTVEDGLIATIEYFKTQL